MPLPSFIMGGLVQAMETLSLVMGGFMDDMDPVLSRLMGGPPVLHGAFPHTSFNTALTSIFLPLLHEFRMLLHQWHLHSSSLLRRWGLGSILTRLLRRLLQSRCLSLVVKVPPP